jgi:hypothetical protein
MEKKEWNCIQLSLDLPHFGPYHHTSITTIVCLLREERILMTKERNLSPCSSILSIEALISESFGFALALALLRGLDGTNHPRL